MNKAICVLITLTFPTCFPSMVIADPQDRDPVQIQKETDEQKPLTRSELKQIKKEAERLVKEARRKEVQEWKEEAEIYNPDRFPSIGISAGLDSLRSPINSKTTLYSVDGRLPVDGRTTLYGEVGVLHEENKKPAPSASGFHARAGLRWYFHK